MANNNKPKCRDCAEFEPISEGNHQGYCFARPFPKGTYCGDSKPFQSGN